MDQLSPELLWKAHLEDSGKLPGFFKSADPICQAHWVDDSEWVQGAMEKRTIGGRSLQSGSHFLCAGRAGNAVHEGLPQLKEIQVTRANGIAEESLRNGSIFGAVRAAKAVHRRLPQLNDGMGIHVHTVELSNEFPLSKSNDMMHGYVKGGSMVHARQVFDNMPKRDVVSWNIMILGYAKHQAGGLALDLYARMLQEGVQPSSRTFVSSLKACSSLTALELGRQVDGKFMKIGCLEKGRAIHSKAIKNGFESDQFVGNSLVDMYTTCGSMEDARCLFDELLHRDVFTWTAMILGCSKQEDGVLALDLYARMQQECITPDHRTFVATLNAVSSMTAAEVGKQVDGKVVKKGSLERGRAIHSQLVKSGFDLDVFVGTALVDMYTKCGRMKDARCVFEELPYRNLVTWTTMISGYSEQEESEEAFRLYAKMQQQGLSPDSLAFLAILKACGNTADLETGKELHSQISMRGLETFTILANSLIDMYAKCGSMVDAQHLFDALPTKDVVTWSSLIAGYARQGESELVFHLFDRMRQVGTQPGGVTFLSVLTVCSHMGLLDKGQTYFAAMSKEYGIMLSIEHYTCMVDLLGRAGKVNEAVAMVDKMPFRPDVVVWVTVLGACRKWKNVLLGRHAFENAVRLDKKHPAPYALMTSIYSDAHMLEDSAKIQAMRRTAHVWKRPGQSWWTDLGGTLHTFMVEDRRHPQSKDIYRKLKDLYLKMEQEGYVSNLTLDDQKEDALCGHSEKLAVACALINTPEGTSIRVVKNLQVCDDCHKAIALISKIEHRNIICRDASRFHNYKEGKCSCGDYC